MQRGRPRHLAEAGQGGGVSDSHRLNAILESCQDGVLAHDVSGNITAWDGGARDLFGYSHSEAIGQQVSVLVASEGLEDLATILDAIAGGGNPRRLRTTGLTSDGRPLEVALTIAPIRDHTGTVVGASTIVRDLSERTRLVRQVEGLRSELDAATTKAREAEDRNRRFLEHAAHQLRTPMACISACVDNLQWGYCPGESETLVTDLQRETARATRLMQSLLRMARLDEGLAIVPRPFDLVSLFTEEGDRAHSLAPFLDIVVRITDRVDEPPVIDGNAIREILSNILDNARRHALSRISVEALWDGQRLQVAVSDDGAGLDHESAVRVFERFVSLDGKGGSGVGLPIARTLARAHGGDLLYDAGAFVFWVATGTGAGEPGSVERPLPATPPAGPSRAGPADNDGDTRQAQ